MIRVLFVSPWTSLIPPLAIRVQVQVQIHFYNSGTHLPDGASNIETKYIQIYKEEKIQYCELGA